MEIIIKVTPKEIADLVLAVQVQHISDKEITYPVNELAEKLTQNQKIISQESN